MTRRRFVGYVVKMLNDFGDTEYRAGTLCENKKKIFQTFEEAQRVARSAPIEIDGTAGRYIVPVFKKA